jgi:hypothetical protein
MAKGLETTKSARMFFFLNSVIGYHGDIKTRELESWANIIPGYDKHGKYYFLIFLL